MKHYEFTIGDVFPVDDPVARWLVTISVGMNDVLLANKKFIASKLGYEYIYFFRLASTHLWELAKFISQTYGAWEEIRTFVDGLSEEAREHFGAIAQIAATGDLSTVGTELVQIRDLFGHYQEMDLQKQARPRDPITKALRELADKTGDIDLGDDTVGGVRLGYADAVVAGTVLRLMPEEDDKKRILESLANGAGNVVLFVQMALGTWLEPRLGKLHETDVSGAVKPLDTLRSPEG